MFSKYVVTVFLALASFHVGATCSNAYGLIRAPRISAELAQFSAQDSVVVVVGDSHIERASIAYAQGSLSIDGHPLVFAGIAGATWETLKNCIPWSSISAIQPSKIIIMASVNDAATGACCSGVWATAAYGAIIKDTVNLALAITQNVTIASDPPPESAQGMNAQTVHSAARMVYYTATKCGSSCPWGDVNSSGNLQYIDVYSSMSAASCTSSIDSSYATIPCYAGSLTTMDNVHLTRGLYQTLMGWYGVP